MLTILMIILIHLCIVAINITLTLWVILSDDDAMGLQFKRNAFAFFVIFCPITNIFSMMMLIFTVSAIWLFEGSD